jgi:hypothetical protein
MKGLLVSHVLFILILNNTGKVKGKVYLIETKSETDKNLFKSTEALGKDYKIPAKSTKWKTNAANLDENYYNYNKLLKFPGLECILTSVAQLLIG